MKQITQAEFDEHVAQSTLIRPRLAKELRFVTSTRDMDEAAWADSEMVAITDRTGVRGVLLLQPEDDVLLLPYELKQGLTSSTGRAQAIICDLCRTWQTGTRSGSITFAKDKRASRTVSYLCCGDLQCSRHVRGQTLAAKTSRSQLREDLTPEQRIQRLKDRLRHIATELTLE